MNEIDCHVVADLMPLYLEGLTSDETNEIIERHMQSCPDCKSILDDLRRPILIQKTGGSKIDKKIAKRLQMMDWTRIVRFSVLLVFTFLAVALFIFFSQNFILPKYIPLIFVGALGYVLFRKWIEPFIAIVLTSVIGIVLCVLLYHTSVLPFLITLPENLLFSFSGYFIAFGFRNTIKKIHFLASISVTLFILILTFVFSFTGVVDRGIVWFEALQYAHMQDLHLTYVEFVGPMDYYVVRAADNTGAQHIYSISSYLISERNHSL